MAVLNKNPGVAADVGYRGWGYIFTAYGEAWANSAITWAGYIQDDHGYGYKTEAAYETSIRFPNVTITQGAEISAATLSIKQDATAYGTQATMHVQAFDEDNSAIPTSFANFGAKARTSASVTWTEGSLSAGVTYTSPDIKTVIQEIVNRGGWSSGNALQICLSDSTYKYPSYPGVADNIFRFFQGNTTLADYDLNITYTDYADSGIRIRDTSATVKIGYKALVGTHKLRFYDGSAIVGIPLLSTGDSNASALKS